MAGLTAMSTVHAEFRTSDRKLWTGLVGFLVGSGATLAVFIWVWIKYPSPEPGWWAVFTSVHLLLHFLFLTVMAGLLFAWMLVTLLDRWYYFRGVYRCHACGRKALRGFVPCVCMPAEVQENYRRFYSLEAISRKRRMRFRRGFRRALRSVKWFLPLIPFAYFVAMRTPIQNKDPFVVKFVGVHASICLIIAFLSHFYSMTLELFHRGRRTRLRIAAYSKAFYVWPLICLMAYVVFSAMGFAHGT